LFVENQPSYHKISTLILARLGNRADLHAGAGG
jgi:hypothetical protein